MPNYIGRIIFQNKLVSTIAKAPLYLPDTYQYDSDKTRSPNPQQIGLFITVLFPP